MSLLKLRIELLKRDLTQADLARGIGRSPAHVSRILSGRIRARARDRRRIVQFLGLPKSKLFPNLKRTKRGGLSKAHGRGLTSGACGSSSQATSVPILDLGLKLPTNRKRWPKTSRRSPVSSAKEGPEGAGGRASRPRVAR